MRTFRDSKAIAKSVREHLAAKQISLSHSESLELVAKAFGFDNWNVLAARIGSDAIAFGDDAIAFGDAVPVIRIFDVHKAREFYVDFLGFKFDWIDAGQWQPASHPLYTQISRGALVLHLTEHHGDASPGSTVYATVANIEALHAELTAKNYTYNRPGIEDVPWGRTLQVSDPFGNRLRFTEPAGARRPPQDSR